MATLRQAEVEANIKSVRWVNGAHINRSMHPNSTPFDIDTAANLSRVTICLIELKNGFICTGVNACTDRDAWSEELALKYSYNAALDKAWEFMGYLHMENKQLVVPSKESTS